MTVDALPPAGFGGGNLSLRIEPAGTLWRRLYLSVHTNPLGYALGLSRFSDPTGTRFAVIYLGSSIKVAFAEVLLRDRGAGRTEPTRLYFADLGAYACAKIQIAEDLHLVDLTGDGCVKLRVPTDVIGARDQALARAWSEAFFDHAARPDGILYPSRLNGEPNIALFDRAIGKLTALSVARLVDRRDDLARIIRDFDLEIL